MKEQEIHREVVIKPQEGFQMQFASSRVDVVFGGGNLGGGKMTLLTDCVITPYGLRKVGDLKVGDVISDPTTGGSQSIAQLHPIEEHEFYRLTFDDGTYVDCSEGHLWKVKKSGGEWKLKEAITIFNDYQDNANRKRKLMYGIPITEAISFSESMSQDCDRPLHPYFVGNMIGNGCMSNFYINELHKVSLTTPFDEIAIRLSKLGFDMSHFEERSGCKTYHIYNKVVRDSISHIGLSGKTSIDKFIPDSYKYAPVEERKELMRGLIDSDGSVDERGRISYYTISEKLANDVAFVARSLGYWVSKHVQTNRRYKTSDGETHIGKDLYRLRISCKNPKEIVTVKNKASRLHDRVREMTKSIKSIEPIGRKIGRCITVSNQHGLYATKDFIVTHNSFALVLALAEPLMTDGDFRAVITRRSLQSQKTGGSFVDTFKAIFGDYCSVKTADSPRISFPSGAYCDLTYIDDTNLDKMREQWKGKQIDAICIDEITEMSWEAFSYVQTRNRGRSKTFTGKFFATLNPKRSHWTRKFLDWYIGVDGFIMPDRNGKVRYFYVNGSTVDDVVWGDSKEEVYAKCKIDIDRKLARIGGDFDYTNMIKSFVFYQGKLSENRAMLENNPNYIGSVAASGGKMAQAIIEGNFNVDPEENEKIPIPSTSAQGVFNNNPAVNGDKWITVDLADYGTDNLVALAWDGFHAYDILILSKSTPRENAMAVKTFAFEHGTAESHIIFDATAGRYFNDYIPDAVPYISLNKPFGLYQLTAMTVKDMCYIRLCKMIEEGNLTFDNKLAVQTYTHQNLKYKVTVENEFMEECSVVRFDDMQSGKKRLWNKKKMNQMLGKGRSMDLLDPCAMRMLPCANIEYGNEIQAGYYNHEEETKQVFHAQTEGSIYDEHLWY